MSLKAEYTAAILESIQESKLSRLYKETLTVTVQDFIQQYFYHGFPKGTAEEAVQAFWDRKKCFLEEGKLEFNMHKERWSCE